ncbi:MAG: methyltransferase domain-containing protein [Pyrinomonadaceae bacterium]
MLDLTRDEMYDNGEMMAPGGLFLAKMMADKLDLRPGQKVLDLGCGRGQSSVFLAAKYRVNVVSVDLWVGSEERRSKAAKAGVVSLITPLQGDIKRGLPSGFGEFDAIFALQSFHTFGTSSGIVKYLTGLLRTGGKICIAQTCFSEKSPTLPEVFRETDGWNADYEKYHSPDWWRQHLERTAGLKVEYCEEITDGEILWEDHALYCGDRAGWTTEYLEKTAWLNRQLLWGRSNSPSLTHFMLTATKN